MDMCGGRDVDEIHERRASETRSPEGIREGWVGVWVVGYGWACDVNQTAFGGSDHQVTVSGFGASGNTLRLWHNILRFRV